MYDICRHFSSYNDHISDQLDPLLTQLLLKSSQDKRFVCEAAEKALVAMTTHVSPALLLPKLQPCLKNMNPQIRAKASMCFSRSVPRLGIEGIREYGIEKLVQAAASQLSDQLPESREAARTVLLELQTVYKKTNPVEPEEKNPEAATWQVFSANQTSHLLVHRLCFVSPMSLERVLLWVHDTSPQFDMINLVSRRFYDNCCFFYGLWVCFFILCVYMSRW